MKHLYAVALLVDTGQVNRNLILRVKLYLERAETKAEAEQQACRKVYEGKILQIYSSNPILPILPEEESPTPSEPPRLLPADHLREAAKLLEQEGHAAEAALCATLALRAHSTLQQIEEEVEALGEVEGPGTGRQVGEQEEEENYEEEN